MYRSETNQQYDRHRGIRRRWAAMLLCFLVLLWGLPARAAALDTSYNADGNISVTAKGRSVFVTVPQRQDYRYVRLGLLSGSTGVAFTGNLQKVGSGSVSMSTSSVSDGIYYLQLWKSEDGVFTTEILTDRLGIIIQVTDGRAEVRPSDAYGNYYAYYSGKDSSVETLYDYLRVSPLIQNEDSRIIRKAQDITRGISSAYDRARAIHDWVATNIYYNMDAERSDNVVIGNNLFVDAVGTLNKQTSVCQGYADLTVALLRASGIPARTVIGYALTDTDEEWDEKKISADAGQNHAWVEAFLRERWVLMDPTWDSRSIYYKGSGIKADCVDTYFDTTLDFFAYGHLQTVADEFPQDYIKLVFTDIRDHWGYPNIRFAINNEIMHGMGDAWFRPDGTTTQAMFLTMLANIAGEDIHNAETGPWYTTYAAWGENTGITAGVGGYNPPDLITREQMAVFLYHFIVNRKSAVKDHNVEEFTDIGQAADWSRDAIRQLASWNILLGRGDGQFDPKACFTRAEAATIVSRACDITLRTYLNS